MFKKTAFALVASLAFTNANNLRTTVADSQLASADDIVNLTKIEGSGYVANVNLDKKGTKGKMLVSLYHSSQMLTDHCWNFDDFNCKQFDTCSEIRPASYYYPSFGVMGTHIKTHLSLVDSSSWALSSEATAFVGNDCRSKTYRGSNNKIIGFLGLGFDRNADKNFQKKSFGIYNYDGVKIAFNPNIKAAHEVVSKVKTDANWRVSNVQSMKFGRFSNKLSGVGLIFDINSDAIGIPYEYFDSFEILLRNSGVECDGYDQPECRFNGDYKALPNIELIVDSRTKITITPQMYAVNRGKTEFNLNLRALSPENSGHSYITAQYKDNIVLGVSVIANGITLFDTESSTVSFIKL